MTGPLFFAALAILAVAVPAVAAWKLRQKSSQNIRMISTILAGQLFLTPGILWLAYSEDRNFGDQPVTAILVYMLMAVTLSIMAFAILEMRKMSRNK